MKKRLFFAFSFCVFASISVAFGSYIIKNFSINGVDGNVDRAAKRYCDHVFLLWENTVGDCKGTWYYTAHSFPDAHVGASPDAGELWEYL